MFGLYIRVMVATGARRAEVCGLRWTDVDPATATLTVQRSYTIVPGVRGDRPTKTRSARTVALDPVTLDELENAWMATRALAQQCGLDVELRRMGYIFAMDPIGESAWRPDTANARWVRARNTAALPSVRLHDLRHFQATQLLDAGVLGCRCVRVAPRQSAPRKPRPPTCRLKVCSSTLIWPCTRLNATPQAAFTSSPQIRSSRISTISVNHKTPKRLSARHCELQVAARKVHRPSQTRVRGPGCDQRSR